VSNYQSKNERNNGESKKQCKIYFRTRQMINAMNLKLLEHKVITAAEYLIGFKGKMLKSISK